MQVLQKNTDFIKNIQHFDVNKLSLSHCHLSQKYAAKNGKIGVKEKLN